MTVVALPDTLWPLVSHLDPGGRESAGIAFAQVVRRAGGTRLLVNSVSTAAADHYVSHGPAEAVLAPAFVATEVAKARRDKLAAVFFHTHPFARHATFSSIDNQGELALREFMDRRMPGLPHAAIVIG